MPRPFAITAASNSVFLDEDRKGEARFTVSNQSGRSIEGRARLVTEEAEPWVTLRGSAHREFSTAGTEEYTVEIDVPPDAPSGSYTVRLDMVGEERPDEQYVEGPAVTFEVPEPEEESKPFPWKIVAAIAAVLVVGGGVLAYVLSSGSNEGTTEAAAADTAVVPNISGVSVDTAESTLKEAGFHSFRYEEVYDDSVPEGEVIETEPPGEEKLITDSTVVLRVSLGPELVEIPYVRGRRITDVLDMLLDEIGLNIAGVHWRNSSIPEGRVIEILADEEEVPKRTKVTVVASTGESGDIDPGYRLPPEVAEQLANRYGFSQEVLDNLNNRVFQPGQTLLLGHPHMDDNFRVLNKLDRNDLLPRNLDTLSELEIIDPNP